MKWQVKAERQWKAAKIQRKPTGPITSQRYRKELALLIAKSARWVILVMKRLLRQDVGCVRFGELSVSRQGSHPKVTSWLSDEGTILAMREYMLLAGEGMFIY